MKERISKWARESVFPWVSKMHMRSAHPSACLENMWSVDPIVHLHVFTSGTSKISSQAQQITFFCHPPLTGFVQKSHAATIAHPIHERTCESVVAQRQYFHRTWWIFYKSETLTGQLWRITRLFDILVTLHSAHWRDLIVNIRTEIPQQCHCATTKLFTVCWIYLTSGCSDYADSHVTIVNDNVSRALTFLAL